MESRVIPSYSGAIELEVPVSCRKHDDLQSCTSMVDPFGSPEYYASAMKTPANEGQKPPRLNEYATALHTRRNASSFKARSPSEGQRT